VVRQMPIGVMIAEAPSGRMTYCNEESQRIFRQGFPALEGFAEYDAWRVFRLDGSPVPREEHPIARALLKGETVISEELQIERGNGTPGFVTVNAAPLSDPAGRIASAVAAFMDITEKKAAAEALRASEAKFRWLFESNLIAIFFWNYDGNIIEANQAYCDLVGFTPEECRAGKLNWLDATPQELFPKDFAAIEEIMAQGVCKPYEKEFINRSDGHRVPVLCAGARMAGTETEGMGFAIDLTELKRAEEAWKESEASLKLAIETTGLGTFDCDLRSGKVVWSDITKRHFGLPPEAQVTHELFLSGVHPDDRERVERAARDMLSPEAGGVYSAKYRTIGIEDGRERWLSVRGQVFFDESGQPVRMVGACLDISDIVLAETALKEEISERLRAVEELHKQEQLLIRQGRLAALGEMIGNIAHQWRQPLNTLALIVQELPWYYERNQFSKEYLDANVARAMQVINHMSKTIDGFRNFFAPDKEKVSFRLGEVLANTVSIVRAAFNELNLEIEVHSDPDIFVFGCTNEFSQVILNILVNAKDALLERKVEGPKVVVRLFSEKGRAVLTIADNAGGIPDKIMDKIFDPYFTTKGPDKGTGIGLFMSKTIVEKNMNGTLSVRNTEEGAEFRIEV
jgi:PAS domain S-box-containing protein